MRYRGWAYLSLCLFATGLLISTIHAAAEDDAKTAGRNSSTSAATVTEKDAPQSAPSDLDEPGEKSAAEQDQSKKTTDEAEKKKPEAPSYLRVQRNEDGEPVTLDAAVVRFKPKQGQGPEVDLIAAVHIGDKAYYDELNRRFKNYDALLYELVAPVDADLGAAMKKSRGDHPVSMMQRGMRDILKLDFQLESVDYTAKNFVHADMTPEEFAESMHRRGESMLQILFRMLGQSMAAQSSTEDAPSDLQLLIALFSKDRAYRLRRMMAEQFENMDVATAALTGPEGSTLITERNKKALDVLRREMDSGKKKLAIFYGAGHLADMEARLINDFQLQRDREEWLVAWTLNAEKNAGSTSSSKPATDAK